MKNWTYYFLNDMINIKDFDSSLLKIDKKSSQNIGIYGYITIKGIDDYKNVYGVNLLYLIICKVDGFIEEKNESRCLVFDSTDESKKVLKNTQNFGMGLKIRLRQ